MYQLDCPYHLPPLHLSPCLPMCLSVYVSNCLSIYLLYRGVLEALVDRQFPRPSCVDINWAAFGTSSRSRRKKKKAGVCELVSMYIP